MTRFWRENRGDTISLPPRVTPTLVTPLQRTRNTDTSRSIDLSASYAISSAGIVLAAFVRVSVSQSASLPVCLSVCVSISPCKKKLNKTY